MNYFLIEKKSCSILKEPHLFVLEEEAQKMGPLLDGFRRRRRRHGRSRPDAAIACATSPALRSLSAPTSARQCSSPALRCIPNKQLLIFLKNII